MVASQDDRVPAADERAVRAITPTIPVFQTLIQHHLDAIALLDADGRILYLNPSAEAIVGYPPAALIGRNHLDLMHPDDCAVALPRFQALTAAAGRVGSGRFRLRHRDGSWRWIEGTSSNLLDDPGVRAILSTFRDVTARLREEDRRAFLDQAAALLGGSLDYFATLRQVAELAVPEWADWTTVHVVEADGRLHRLATAHVDPSKQALLAELPGAEWSTQPGNSLHRVFRTGEPHAIYVVQQSQLDDVAADDRHRALFALLRPRSSIIVPLLARGRPLGALSFVLADSERTYTSDDLPFFQDLARRAALAVDNARLYREAQQARQHQEEFLSIAAHELKTPLTAIAGFTQLLARETRQPTPVPERIARRVDILREQVDRLQALVSDLLDASQLQQGRLKLRRERIDLADLVRIVLEREAGDGDGDAARVQIVADVPVLGEWDPARLDQVVTNLLSNARKYSGPASPVELSVGRDGNVAVLAVRDRGIGISPEDQVRIFEPFGRAGAGTQVPGTGLGLYISRRIVEQHDGTLDVESTPGQGSTFTVRLPLDADVSATSLDGRVFHAAG